jgi:hypothetical protein
MTQTFAGIPNSIRGLTIGRNGAIHKLVTGRGSRDVGFVLKRYSIEDDEIANRFKIVIRGTARDVLCAQRFVFNHISKSHKRARAPFGNIQWNYDDELKGFVFQFHRGLPSVRADVCSRELAQANRSTFDESVDAHGCAVPPPTDDNSSGDYDPTMGQCDIVRHRPCTPPGPPPARKVVGNLDGPAANWTADADWSSPPSKHNP